MSSTMSLVVAVVVVDISVVFVSAFVFLCHLAGVLKDQKSRG